ncbi:MAG: bifunctional adenosylcobinamide kinase/adenosylcobinamide-phosphate guanylyltransferase [Victivallales bacterium]
MFILRRVPCWMMKCAGAVKLHRERRRGYQWITIEEQLDLAGALKRAQEENADGVLIDCLTLWINNLMYHLPQFDEEEMKKKTADLLGALEEYPGQVVLVLNEVGLGIVPGRRRDVSSGIVRGAAGRCARRRRTKSGCAYAESL